MSAASENRQYEVRRALQKVGLAIQALVREVDCKDKEAYRLAHCDFIDAGQDLLDAAEPYLRFRRQ